MANIEFQTPIEISSISHRKQLFGVGKGFNMEKTVPCIIIIHGSGISHHCYDGVCFITQFKFLSAYSTIFLLWP